MMSDRQVPDGRSAGFRRATTDQQRRRDLATLGVPERVKAIDKQIKDIVVEAAKFAEDAPAPDAAELHTDVLVGSY